jgi:hypothetical protein
VDRESTNHCELTTFGGYIAKDGWDKSKDKRSGASLSKNTGRDDLSGNSGNIAITNYGAPNLTAEAQLPPRARLKRRINALSQDILIFASNRRREDPDTGLIPTNENYEASQKRSSSYSNETRSLYVRNFSGPASAACEELKNLGLTDKYLEHTASSGTNILSIESVGTSLARLASQLPDQ